MSPIFAIIAWPFAKLNGCRLVLWYLHRSNTFKLRLAERLVDNIVTADAASLTLKSHKIVSIGHGINVARFATVRDWTAVDRRPLHVLSVGRLSPIKDFATLIRAAAILRDEEFDLEVRIVGRPVMPKDREYERELQATVARLGLANVVHFVGLVPYSAIPAEYSWADVVVGCTPPGGIDKALLEAMAAGCIVLTSNYVMARYMRPYFQKLMFRVGQSEELAERISSLGEYDDISRALATNVKTDHDLSMLASRLAQLL